VHDWIRALRPQHALKNLFVLAPIPFALRDGAGSLDALRLLLGLCAFTAASGAVYLFNDLCDAQSDRADPTKRNRPIAAGRISPGSAKRGAAALALVALSVAGARGAPTLALYMVINVAYSVGLKRVPTLELFLVASGFLLRVIFGCVLVGAPASAWLLLCTTALALLLVLGKRRAELKLSGTVPLRAVLCHYGEPFLVVAMAVAAMTAFLGYAIYAVESGAFARGREFASVPIVLLAVLEYLRLSLTVAPTLAPERLVYAHPQLLLCVALWLGVAVLSFA
jgi:4-hydroxybenzoate polyprenyltransferase